MQFQTASIRDLIAEEGMDHLFVESLLKLRKEDFAPFIFEPIRPQFDDEIIQREHPFVEHSQNYRVHDNGSELFYKIEG